MNCNFTYNHYREILKVALAAGFRITNFRDIAKIKSEKVIILRHDVDYSPKRALEIAKIEAKLGIKSTYFVRVHGEYYHPFDRINFPYFKTIKKMGHEIGLHTEARNLSKLYETDMISLFKLEKKMLEEIFKVKVESAAEHADLGRSANYWKKHLFTQIDKKEVGIKRFPQEFQDFHYFSDSLGKWKQYCICQNLSQYDKIQLLIHPDWWGEGARKEIQQLIKNNPNLFSKHKYFN